MIRIALLCEEQDEGRMIRLAEGLATRGFGAHVVVAADTERATARALRRVRAQVVHAQSLGLAAAFCGAARRAGARVLAQLTGDGVELGGSAAAELPWHAADALCFEDRASEALALRHGLPEILARGVVPAAAEPALFELEPGRGESSRLNLVSIAPLHWTQGLDHAVHAVAIAARAGADVHYTIAGEGELLPALTFARHQLGVAERVRLVEPEHGLEELALAHAALHPQLVDGVSRGLAFALAAGLPVLMTWPGEIGDESPAALAGFEVPRRDPDALAERIARLAGDAELRERLGLAARELALERHRPELELDGLAKLYRAVAACEAERAPVAATS